MDQFPDSTQRAIAEADTVLEPRNAEEEARVRLEEEIAQLEAIAGTIPPKEPGSKRSIPDTSKHAFVRLHALLEQRYGRVNTYQLCSRFHVDYPAFYDWRNKFDANVSLRGSHTPPPAAVEGNGNGHASVASEPNNRASQGKAISKTTAPVQTWLRSNIESIPQSAEDAAEQEERTEQIRREVGLVIEGDPEMERAWKQAVRASVGQGQVLLRGETGTGKELFARAIHGLHAGNGARFHALNCAGLNEGVIESELFGHKKGAFTDAREDRDGAFGIVAEGGTLLLDEIGDMPMSQQGKLLRVLESREFSRVGSTQVIKLQNAKVVAATNRPLEELVAQGKFRKDLLFRLAENQVNIPSLRERQQAHFQYLVGHFIRKMEGEGPFIYMTPEALETLQSLDHPGNVRDLRHHIQRASNEARRGVRGESLITTDHIRSTHQENGEHQVQVSSEVQPYLGGALHMSLSPDQSNLTAVIDLSALEGNSSEIMNAIRALMAIGMVDKNLGNQSQAAKKLGVSRGLLREVLHSSHDILRK